MTTASSSRSRQLSQSDKVARREERVRLTTRGSVEKKRNLQVKLHRTRLEREIQHLKDRLTHWDPVEEGEKAQLKRKQQEEEGSELPKKRKGRGGPETWKLRGAARPAWQVYDFDTRYVCPHQAAHVNARLKTQRSVNQLAVYRGRIHEGPEELHQYLGLLMEYAHASKTAKQYKTARQTWLECLDLEGSHPLTTAREELLQMYIGMKKIDSALELGAKYSDDTSVWVRFPMACMSLQTSHEQSSLYVQQAIQANPLCAWYLAFYDTFVHVMECTDEIVQHEDDPQSLLEEAIDYCASDQVKQWTDSARKAFRDTLLSVYGGRHSALHRKDVDWNLRLDRLEEDLGIQDENNDKEENERKVAEVDESSSTSDSNNTSGEGDDGSSVTASSECNHGTSLDLGMYIRMFRTAMDIVRDSGQLK
jgi:hypothetical protein